MRIFALASFFLFICSCQNDTTSEQKVVVKNTPKTVAQYWLENYFADNFAAAKPYSTPTTQTMMDTIQKIIFLDEGIKPAFKITALQCEENLDKAKCTYVYVEEGEKIPETIELQKVNDKWLVNAQLMEEDEAKELESVKKLFQ